MSNKHGVYSSPETLTARSFLDVAPGITVIVKHDDLTAQKAEKDWWMGQIIHWVVQPVIRIFITCSRSLMWIQV